MSENAAPQTTAGGRGLRAAMLQFALKYIDPESAHLACLWLLGRGWAGRLLLKLAGWM